MIFNNKRTIIARGSYGTVYKSLNKGKYVAVKKITNSESGVECLIEALIMNNLNHPYINRCHEIKLTKKCMYIYQDLALCDLHHFYHKYELSYDKCVEWSYHLTLAVNYMHNNRLIHGDIKSHNILVYKKELHTNEYDLSGYNIKLADFTLSLLSNKLDINSGVICTSTHRPPEVWNKKNWNYKIDIWSLGCTFFEMSNRVNLFQYKYYSYNNKDIQTNVILKMMKFFKENKDGYFRDYFKEYFDESDKNSSTLNYVNNNKTWIEYNKIIDQCLEEDIIKRTTTEDILSNCIYNKYKTNIITPYKIKISNSYVSLDKLIEIKRYFSSYDENISNLCMILYCRIYDIKGIKDETKKLICLYICAKLYNIDLQHIFKGSVVGSESENRDNLNKLEIYVLKKINFELII